MTDPAATLTDKHQCHLASIRRARDLIADIEARLTYVPPGHLTLGDVHEAERLDVALAAALKPWKEQNR